MAESASHASSKDLPSRFAGIPSLAGHPAVVALLFVMVGLYDSAQHFAYERMRGAHFGFAGGLARNFPFWALWIPLTYAVARFARAVPPALSARRVLAHLGAAAALGAAHIALWVVLRDFFAHGNLPPADYAHLLRKFVPARIGLDVLVYGAVLALTSKPGGAIRRRGWGDSRAARAIPGRRPGDSRTGGQGDAHPRREPDRLVLASGGRTYVISRRDTERVEAEGDYMRIHGDVESLVRVTMGELDEALGPGFVRVSRSALVNAAHVRELRRVAGERWEARMASGARVPVTAAYRDGLEAALHRLAAGTPKP